MTIKKFIAGTTVLLTVAVCLSACSGQEGDDPDRAHSPKVRQMTFSVSYPGTTRATSTDFEENDSIGVYVTLDGRPLETGGNVANNEPLTLKSGTWTTAHILYWDEGGYNVYAYYPYRRNITSVDEQPFVVSSRQDVPRNGSMMGGYEASDLLYASAKGVQGSTSPIHLQFRHIMSKLKIRLVKSEDFEGEMPRNAEVYVHSTVTEATVDLSAGVATYNPKVGRQSIRARQDGDYTYSAIVVPQRLDNRMPLLEVVMGGVSYLFESRFTFKPGVEHLINIVITNNPEKADINIGGEIEGWN